MNNVDDALTNHSLPPLPNPEFRIHIGTARPPPHRLDAGGAGGEGGDERRDAQEAPEAGAEVVGGQGAPGLWGQGG